MMIQDAVVELWGRLGEPSDLNPYTGAAVDFAKVETQKLRLAINQAEDVVATFICGNGRRIRFRDLEDSFTFEAQQLTGTMTTQTAPYKDIILPVGFSATNNRFADWVLSTNGESRRIIRSWTVGGIEHVLLNKGLSSDPIGLGFTIAQRVYEIDSTSVDTVVYGNRMIEMTQVIDLESGVELDLAAGDEFFTATSANIMTPSQWSKRSGRLVFDTAPADARSYEVRCIRYPIQALAATDVLELPEAFQQAALIRAEWWGYGYLQEPQMAYAKKRDFVELMNQLRTEMDLESDYDQDFFRIRKR